MRRDRKDIEGEQEYTKRWRKDKRKRTAVKLIKKRLYKIQNDGQRSVRG